ncbi:hypothetical protein Tco_0860877 [Tanacetum coccineum]|uniref:Uncharacterized protein n=1 Tax=Tanacetum coccineum TaxID=301880 RepID=A0ABQ5BG66_9ASTR
MIQVRLNATVRNIHTDIRTKFLNQTLKSYYEDVRISHQNSVARPALYEMTPGTINSGLMQNPPSSIPLAKPTKNDWDLLFQQMFDEYFDSPLSVMSRRLPPIPLQIANTTGTPLSTFVEQDAPAVSTSSITQETQSLVIHDDVEE